MARDASTLADAGQRMQTLRRALRLDVTSLRADLDRLTFDERRHLL